MITINPTYNLGENLAVKKQKELEKQNQLAFEGRRTDRNYVKILTEKDGQALFRSKARQIEEAIGRLAGDSSKNNIEFLLGVAENLQYGVRKGSAMERFIKSESSIADKEQVQNIKWEKLLQNAIAKALEGYKEKDKPQLEAKFGKLFPATSKDKDPVATSMTWLSVNPTAKLEREAIKSSREILNSDVVKNHPSKELTNKIKKHVDYFMASSEVAIAEKAEILKQLAWFVSDDYKINPQLKDKKVEILAELINDVVVKTPESPVLTAKDMLQKHGTCAAISTSRKTMAHEHKLAYINNLLAEFDEKPTMEVWDVTDPKNEDKITVQKANIDWNAAMAEDYRFVDAAVTNWMHIADNMGNGLVKAGQFVPFDVEHYGMFRDAHLMLDMAPEYQPKYDLLRATMKLKGAVKKIQVDKVERQEASQELRNNELENSAFHAVAAKQVEDILSGLAQEAGSKAGKDELHKLAGQLLNTKVLKDEARKYEDQAIALDKAGKPEEAAERREKKAAIDKMTIDTVEGPKVKKEKLTQQILSAMPEVSKENVDKVIEDILKAFKFIDDLNEHEDDLSGKFKLKGNNKYQKNLFTVAAYYRVKKEFEVKIPERLEAMAKELNVPAEPEAVLKKLEDTGAVLPRATLDKMYAEFEKIDRYLEKDLKKSDPRWMSETKLYKPFNQFKNDYKAIERSITEIRRETTRDYKALNKELDPQLQEVYEKNGRGEGASWVGEEGHSGLNRGQYSRLLKQQSGKDHYIEGDVKKALDHLEAGKGGGVTGTMVEHYEYSGHAQYVYDTKRENILNPDTGKVEEQRVLYHDNTWGHKELRHTWKDDGGHERTDYGSKRGGPFGYLLDPTLTQGTTENDLLTAIGINKPDKIGKNWAKKFDNSIGTEYPMFMEVILQGPNLAAGEKAQHILHQIFKSVGKDSEKKVERYLNKLLVGNSPKIERLANDITVDVYKAVMKAVDSGDLSTLTGDIESAAIGATQEADPKVFKSGGKKAIVNTLKAGLPQVVEKIMAAPMSDSLKKVQVARAVEQITAQVVNKLTVPGQSVQMKKSKAVEKTTDKTKEQLLKLIRGTSPSVPGVATDSIKMNGIRTREQYDAIPESHLLKMLLNKMVLIDLTQDNQTYIAVDKAKTPEDLQKAKQAILEKHIQEVRSYFNKDESSIVTVKDVFNESALTAIEEIAQEDDIDLKTVVQDLGLFTENIAKTNKGSASQLEKQLEAAITKTVDRFQEATKGMRHETAAKLSARLTEVAKKSIDENIRITSMKEQSDSYMGKMMTHWIDTKFDPQSDAEFLQIVKKLQDMDRKTFDKLLEKSSGEDLGLKYQDPFVLVQRLRGLNSKAERAFGNAVRNHVYNEYYSQKVENEVREIIAKHKEWCKTEEGSKVPAEKRDEILNEKINRFYNERVDLDSMYRNLNIEFSYAGMDKFVASQKQEALDKYGVRPAFPIIKVVDDESVKETLKANIAKIEAMAQQYGQMIASQKEFMGQYQELQTLKPANDEEAAQKAAMIAQADQEKAMIDQQVGALKQQIKGQTQVLVRALIRPRHQDDLMRMINEFAKEASKNPGSELSKHQKEEIIKKGTDDYMLKYPEEFLNHVTKEVPQMAFDKNKMSMIDKSVLGLWSQGMLLTLNAANKSYIEFKIKENISKGRMPQVAKKFRDPEVSMLMDPRTKKGFNFDSKRGIEFLLQSMQDPVNNNSTLKYFVEQSGLTKTAINYFLEGPKPEKSVKLIKFYVDQLNKHKGAQEVIQDTFEQFVGKLYDQLDAKGVKVLTVDMLDTVLEQYFNVLDQAFVKDPENKTLSSYKSTLRESLTVTKQMKLEAPEGDALNFLLEWQEQVLQSQDSYTEEVIEKAITHMNLLNNRKAGLDMFGELVPDFDPSKAQIKEYQIRLDDAIKQIDKIREELQAPILDKIEKAQKEEAAAQQEAMKEVQNMSQEEMMQMVTEQSQAMIQQLVTFINQGDQTGQQAMIQQILKTDNPILDNIVIEMFQKTDSPLLRTYAAGIMAEKGYIDPLAEYVDAAVKDGKFDRSKTVEEDQALVLAINGVIHGTQTPNNQYNMKNAQLIAKVFNAACDHKDATPLMDQVLSNFINGLVNTGQIMHSVLIDEIITNPESHVNAKCIAIDILGRSDTMAYFPVFEQALFNHKDLSDKPLDQLMIINVAMKSIASYANRYPNMFDYNAMLDRMKTIDLDALGKTSEVTEDFGADQVDKLVKQIKERIAKFEEALGNANQGQPAAA